MPIAEIIALREIAGELLKFFKRTSEVNDRRQIESCLKAFKQIYFYDDKTKYILKSVSQGDLLSHEVIKKYYENFCSSEPAVQFSLETIKSFSNDQKSDLSVRIYNKIRSLSQGKWSIRLELDHLFQELLQNQVTDYVKERADRLLAAVGELNRIIEEIDQELRQRPSS
ncbi:hypothetical protein [Ochrobactrum quorumnocens]|uniref:hypothetical protein n=1 Tax=Ochrobactrum quorumnocens TaxID=271865 RepID=UPI003BA25CFE